MMASDSCFNRRDATYLKLSHLLVDKNSVPLLLVSVAQLAEYGPDQASYYLLSVFDIHYRDRARLLWPSYSPSMLSSTLSVIFPLVKYHQV